MMTPTNIPRDNFNNSEKRAVGAGGYPEPNMGYPPSYPGYGAPPSYPGYASQPNPYSYTAAPPASYYTTSHVYVATESSGAVCCRVILIVTFGFMMAAISLSIFSWLLFGRNVVAIRVESLSVPVFNATDKALQAKWEAKILVKNLNTKSEVLLHHVESTVDYKHDLLAIAVMQNFHLRKGSEGNMMAHLSRSQEEHGELEDGVLKAIKQDRSSGAVTFNLRFAVRAIFASGIWRRGTSMGFLCEDLQVGFSGAGVGALVGGGKDCLIHA